ncbi:MAG: hypothetical protein QOG80_3086, partial [Pseudonocardiales bacterium]|nr:hypothetical protein [Pseudonocardiales bacterium]
MRRRILMLVVGMTTLVVVAFVVPLALMIRHVVYQDATEALQNEANQIANFLRGSPTTAPTSAEIATELQKRSGDRVCSVRLPNGTIVGTLPPDGSNLPTPNLHDPHDPESTGPPQPTVTTFHGGKLVQLPVYTGGPGGGGDGGRDDQYTVRVYASD